MMNNSRGFTTEVRCPHGHRFWVPVHWLGLGAVMDECPEATAERYSKVAARSLTRAERKAARQLRKALSDEGRVRKWLSK